MTGSGVLERSVKVSGGVEGRAQRSSVGHLTNEPCLVVILGAGKPHHGSLPSALSAMPDRRRALDWLLEAFGPLPAEVCYVGGYELGTVARHAKRLRFAVNPDWQTTGPLASLFAAPLADYQTCFVCYSDVVFTKNVVEKVNRADGDVVLAVDRNWKRRFSGRTSSDMDAAEKVSFSGGVLTAVGSGIRTASADAEYVGIAKLSNRALAEILELWNQAEGRLRNRVRTR